MILKDQNGREIEVDRVYGERDDIQLEGVFYVDSSEEVPEEVVEWLRSAYPEKLDEAWYDYQVMRAEHYADCAEDR